MAENIGLTTAEDFEACLLLKDVCLNAIFRPTRASPCQIFT